MEIDFVASFDSYITSDETIKTSLSDEQEITQEFRVVMQELALSMNLTTDSTNCTVFTDRFEVFPCAQLFYQVVRSILFQYLVIS